MRRLFALFCLLLVLVALASTATHVHGMAKAADGDAGCLMCAGADVPRPLRTLSEGSPLTAEEPSAPPAPAPRRSWRNPAHSGNAPPAARWS